MEVTERQFDDIIAVHVKSVVFLAQALVPLLNEGGRILEISSGLAPGAIETDFSGGRVRDDPAPNRMVAGMTALGRAGLPDDIGGAAAALLGEGSGWITGQRVEASSGMML
jgi:NAD(P)-dependent dehydrogenase (short-subunit alcohol dehydrogenase family)